MPQRRRRLEGPSPNGRGLAEALTHEGVRMLTTMWVFPLVAASVAFVFAGRLAARYGRRRQAYQLAWALSLGMYGVASLMAVLGVLNGWTSAEFAAYWALGAVLNVPFLAGGEVMLLARRRTVDLFVWLVLIFVVAYTVAVLRNATLDAERVARAIALWQGRLRRRHARPIACLS